MLNHFLKLTISVIGLILCPAAGVLPHSASQGETASVANQADFASGRHLILLLDRNPHQKKVLPVELALAESVVRKLDRPPNTFSLIVFRSQPPTLLKVGVRASEVISVIRSVSVEQTKEKYFSVHFYDTLKMGIDQFTDDSRPEISSHHF